jgi:hypothetical protein
MPLPYYRIDLSEVPAAFVDQPNEPVAVRSKSPSKLRKAVERFAIYFRREFHYDFVQFSAKEKPGDDEPYAAYLFASERNSYPRLWVGACCFRWREYDDVEPRWVVQWMWLHPYFRGKGILGHAWDKFHEVHGNFYCEPPLSRAMEAFLRKRGKCNFCWQPLDTPGGAICARCNAEHKKG